MNVWAPQVLPTGESQSKHVSSDMFSSGIVEWGVIALDSLLVGRVVETPPEYPPCIELHLHVEPGSGWLEFDLHDVTRLAARVVKRDDLDLMTVLESGCDQVPCSGLGEGRVEFTRGIAHSSGFPAGRAVNTSTVLQPREPSKLLSRRIVDTHRHVQSGIAATESSGENHMI